MAAIFTGPGIALATLLHTLGAIGYLGGMAMYIGWRRAILRGDHHPGTLGTAAALTYVSIAANLLGGFIRTYQPGHPKLTAFFDEPWVAVMAIKHVALFVGIFAAAYLIEVQAPRLRRAWKEGRIEEAPTRTGRVMTAVVVLSIVFASIMGGASAVITIGDGAEVETDGLVVPPRPAFASPQHYEGVITSVSEGTGRGTFDVPADTLRIDGDFSVQAAGPDASQLTVALIDPTGARTEASLPQGPNAPRQAEVAVEDPAAGTWTYEVSGTAVQASWSLDLAFTSRILLLEETIDIPAGGFYEISVDAPAGADLAWDWSSDAALEWNIHSHAPSGGVLTEDTTGRSAGLVTTAEAGEHSYAWRADGPTTLTYAVWGPYTLEAIYP